MHSYLPFPSQDLWLRPWHQDILISIVYWYLLVSLLCFKAYSTLFKEVLASTDAVFKYFSKPSGVPAARLGHAMAVLGMNLTEDEDPRQHDLLILLILINCFPVSACFPVVWISECLFLLLKCIFLRPKSGGEAFDGSGLSGVHRPEHVSQSHWGLVPFFWHEVHVTHVAVADGWEGMYNIFDDQQ